jgi:hypothetical protein
MIKIFLDPVTSVYLEMLICAHVGMFGKTNAFFDSAGSHFVLISNTCRGD